MINQRTKTTFHLIRVLVKLVLVLRARTLEGSAIAVSALSFLSKRRMGLTKASTHLMIKAVIMSQPYRDNLRIT